MIISTNRRRSISLNTANIRRVSSDHESTSEHSSPEPSSSSAPASPVTTSLYQSFLKDDLIDPDFRSENTNQKKSKSRTKSSPTSRKRAPNESNPKILASLEEDLKRRTAKRRAKILKKQLGVSTLNPSLPLPTSLKTSSDEKSLPLMSNTNRSWYPRVILKKKVKINLFYSVWIFMIRIILIHYQWVWL